MAIRVSNAFKQKRHLNIDTENQTKPISKVIKEAKAKHIPLKRLAQAGQAEANIKPKNSKAHQYWESVAKKARAEGHASHDGYSIKYPKSELNKISREGHQARLKG